MLIQIWIINLLKKSLLNKTAIKFGYPQNLIREYQYWMLLLRPEQITIGSMVIISKNEIYNYRSLKKEAHDELRNVYSDVESIAYSVLSADKVNFLTLMMVDRILHTHVIPRFSKNIMLNDNQYQDEDWPQPPILTKSFHLNNQEKNYLIHTFKKHLLC